MLAVFLNEKCELHCESKIVFNSENDVKNIKDNSAFLFMNKFWILNKNNVIGSNNIIGSYFKDNITESELIVNIKKSFNDKLNNIKIKTKLRLLNNKITLYWFEQGPNKYLSYLLKKSYIFNNFCNDLRSLDKQEIAYNIIGPAFILKCNNIKIENIFNNLKSYQLHNFTIAYFEKLKENLFINIKNLLLKNNKENLSDKEYLLILYGLYFKLFNNEEILKITSLFDLTHSYFYKKYNYHFGFNLDFKFSFINSLFEKNSINYKLPNNQYCNIALKNKHERIIKYKGDYSERMNYLIELSKMILNKPTYFLGNKEDYQNIKNNLYKRSKILSALFNIDELMFLEKINTNFKFSNKNL